MACTEKYELVYHAVYFLFLSDYVIHQSDPTKVSCEVFVRMTYYALLVPLPQIQDDQSRYETVCDGCGSQEECSGCIVKDNNQTHVCTEVLDHTDSQGGTATLETLVLDPGHWRATNSGRQIMACFNKDACGGGLTGKPDNCSTGYEGPCE